jgi:hypothetical protein
VGAGGVWNGKGGPQIASSVWGLGGWSGCGVWQKGWVHGPVDASHHVPVCLVFVCSQRSEEDSDGTSEAESQADEGPSTKRQKKALLCQVPDCGKVNKGGGFCKFVRAS